MVADLDLVELAVPQPRRHLPDGQAMACLFAPLTKVGGQRIEIVVESVTGEHGRTTLGQALPDFMDKPLCIVVFTPSDVDDRHNLGLRFDSHLDPHPLTHAPHFGHQFIQLQVVSHQVHKKVLVQPLSVLARALRPAPNRPLVMPEDARGRRDIHAFSQCGADFGHPPGRCFQAVQRRIQA
jgi:hypothetical protein